jgi:hypothetical protein
MAILISDRNVGRKLAHLILMRRKHGTLRPLTLASGLEASYTSSLRPDALVASGLMHSWLKA